MSRHARRPAPGTRWQLAGALAFAGALAGCGEGAPLRERAPGAGTRAPAPAAAAQPANPGIAGLRLRATVADATARGRAVIRVGAEERGYSVDDEVIAGVSLFSVHETAVMLLAGDRLVALEVGAAGVGDTERGDMLQPGQSRRFHPAPPATDLTLEASAGATIGPGGSGEPAPGQGRVFHAPPPPDRADARYDDPQAFAALALTDPGMSITFHDAPAPGVAGVTD